MERIKSRHRRAMVKTTCQMLSCKKIIIGQAEKQWSGSMHVQLNYLPIGWVVPFSIAAATARASFSQLGMQQEVKFVFLFTNWCPKIGSIALNLSPPVVNVPVLSNAIMWQDARASSGYD